MIDAEEWLEVEDMAEEGGAARLPDSPPPPEEANPVTAPYVAGIPYSTIVPARVVARAFGSEEI